MRDQFTIGEFARRAGVTARALRVYEELGLIRSLGRGENGYRYFHVDQLGQMKRIQEFKALGFSLREIKALLEADRQLDRIKLGEYLRARLSEIALEARRFAEQKKQIETILHSLSNQTRGLGPNERSYVMRQFEKVSVVVTGVSGLEQTAVNIRQVLGQNAENVVVIPEHDLGADYVTQLKPNVVVIKNISEFSAQTEAAYLRLYENVGPHMTTVFNADDRVSVELAANEAIRRGRIYYFSKNLGLADQIESIGGVISDGDEIKIFGLGQKRGTTELKLNRSLGFDQEVAWLASMAAVIDTSLSKEHLLGLLLR